MIGDDSAPTTSISWAHGIWLCVTFLFGVAFVFVLPVFQTNDEDSHWRRAWTVAVGDVYCHEIPLVADELFKAVNYDRNHTRAKVARVQFVLNALEDDGPNIPSPVKTTSCSYFPLGYLPAALTARLVAFTLHSEPRVGGMICGYYAARLANWLMVTAGVLLLLRAAPWARNVTLLFYSIPEVLQQSVALGLDGFLFLMTCLLLSVFVRPVRRRSVAWMALIVTLMSMTKPIYAPLTLLAMPLIATLYTRGRLGWRGWGACASLLVPVPAWRMWVRSIPARTLTTWGPNWVHPPDQVAFLKRHPWHVFVLLWSQLKNTFSGDLMHGSWTSIFGAFGWSTFEMSRIGYYVLLLALLVALAADWGSPARAPTVNEATGRKAQIAWALAVLGPLAVIAAVILAMYVYYTGIGLNSVNGVQGRYYLVPLLVLAFLGTYALKRRRTPPPRLRTLAPHLVWAAMLLCALADGFAVAAIKDFYWIS